jgi:hypothetical protein
MSRFLRHPIRSIREPFGTAGLIVGIVALIAALGGTALAAKGALTTKQKKEVTAIAKRFAGKAGPPGAQGPQGLAGPAGTNGTNGKNGSNGKSVSAETASTLECPEGGTRFEVEESNVSEHVCNGSPWPAGGTLPSGQTETGAWAASPTESEDLIPLSFNIQLPSELNEEHTLIEGASEFASHCPGSAATPEAESGYLCVYIGRATHLSVAFVANPGQFFTPGAAKSGAALDAAVTQSGGNGWGTWAVTG